MAAGDAADSATGEEAVKCIHRSKLQRRSIIPHFTRRGVSQSPTASFIAARLHHFPHLRPRQASHGVPRAAYRRLIILGPGVGQIQFNGEFPLAPPGSESIPR